MPAGAVRRPGSSCRTGRRPGPRPPGFRVSYIARNRVVSPCPCRCTPRWPVVAGAGRHDSRRRPGQREAQPRLLLRRLRIGRLFWGVSGMETCDPSAMTHSARALPPSAAPACNSWAVRRARWRGRPSEAAPRVAVAAAFGEHAVRPRAARGDDPRHGVAAAVVLAQHLAEEAPEGRDRAEHPVRYWTPYSLRTLTMLASVRRRQRKPVVAREAAADRSGWSWNRLLCLGC